MRPPAKLSRRQLLATATASLAPITGCSRNGSSPTSAETPTDSADTLVIETKETHTATGEQSYTAVEWHDEGALVVEQSGSLELTEQ
jgi:nitrous oxide reductase